MNATTRKCSLRSHLLEIYFYKIYTGTKQIAVSDIRFHQKIIDKYRADIGELHRFPMLIFYKSQENVLFQNNNLHILLGLHLNRYLQIVKSALRPWIVLKEPDKINHFKRLLLCDITSRSGIFQSAINKEGNNKVLYRGSFVRSNLSFNKIALFNSQALDKFSNRYLQIVKSALRPWIVLKEPDKINHFKRLLLCDITSRSGIFQSAINKEGNNKVLYRGSFVRSNLSFNKIALFNSQALDKFSYGSVVYQQLHNVMKIMHYIRRNYINIKNKAGLYPSTMNENQFSFENKLTILLLKKKMLSNNKVLFKKKNGLSGTIYDKQPDDNVLFTRHHQIFLTTKNEDFIFYSSQDIQYEVNQIKKNLEEIQKTVAEKTMPVFSPNDNNPEQYIDMNRVSDQVFQMIDRKIKIESERRGIF